MDQKLEGITATLVLSNSYSLSIVVNNSGDGLKYQYKGVNDATVHDAEIIYIKDTENITGYADTDPMQPAFETKDGIIYFIGEFLRDKF
jgi:hypothetical protein